MRGVRIFLLVLIIIGVVLLITQNIWVPKLVNQILSSEVTPSVSDLNKNTYYWCMANGGQDLTPNYNAPKKCVLENKVYEENCVNNDNYFVIEKDLTDSVGSNHLVKYKTNANQNLNCQYVVDNGDFEIKNEWAEYILALENNFLILDSGTGPDPRDLIIYNLDTRKKVYDGSYSQPVAIQSNTITFWTELPEKATENNCPKLKEYEAGGLGAAIDAHVSLNLSTLAKTDLGQRRCSPRQ